MYEMLTVSISGLDLAINACLKMRIVSFLCLYITCTYIARHTCSMTICELIFSIIPNFCSLPFFQFHLVRFHKNIAVPLQYYSLHTVSAAATKEQETAAAAAVGGDIELMEMEGNGTTLVEEQTPATNYGLCFF